MWAVLAWAILSIGIYWYVIICNGILSYGLLCPVARVDEAVHIAIQSKHCRFVSLVVGDKAE